MNKNHQLKTHINMKAKFIKNSFILIILTQISIYSLFAQDKLTQELNESIFKKIESDFGQANIPGLSL